MKMMAVFLICALMTGAVWFFLYQMIVHIARLGLAAGGRELPQSSKPRFYCLTGWLLSLLVFAEFIAILVQH